MLWRALLPPRSHTPAQCHIATLHCCREEEPEGFHHEVENLAWEESARGCAENAYLALFEVSIQGMQGTLWERAMWVGGSR